MNINYNIHYLNQWSLSTLTHSLNLSTEVIDKYTVINLKNKYNRYIIYNYKLPTYYIKIILV